MKIAGVICEFNPFHNGHAFLAQKAREGGFTHIAGVMSGNFVQRGEPAIFDVSDRVSAALENGYDLILQLPVEYSTAGANGFARGAAGILDAAGCVDSLIFASECGSTAKLEKAAELTESDDVDALIKKELESGISYASARENAVRAFDAESADLLKEPNNILGIEYIRALKNSGSRINPETVPRAGAAHDSAGAQGSFASGAEIRRRIRAGEDWRDYVPQGAYPGELNPADMKKYENLVLYKIRTMSAPEIALLPDVSEGIENRIAKAAYDAGTLEEFYTLAKTKRYSHARIRRIALSALLGITAQDAAAPPAYIRVLGFNDRGAEIIRMMKKTATLPVITKAADFRDAPADMQRVFDLQCRAADIYSLITEKTLACGEEKRFTVIKR